MNAIKGKFPHVGNLRINRPYYKRAHSLRPSEKGGTNKDQHLNGYSCYLQPCFKPRRTRAAPNLTGGVLNLNQLVIPKKLARHVSSERARPLNSTPHPSPTPFPFLLEGRTEIVLHFEMPRSRKIGKRRPPRVLTLDRAHHADRAKVLITMC